MRYYLPIEGCDAACGMFGLGVFVIVMAIVVWLLWRGR